MELWFLMPNYTAERSPSCNNRQAIKNWKNAAGTSPWLSPTERVAVSSVVLHWNFPKACFFLLPQRVDALNQQVLKKTFHMWKSHVYFYVLFWHFKWNLWSCFLCFFSSIFCSLRLKVVNCSKNKTKPFWGGGGTFHLQMKLRERNWDFPVFLKVFLCQKIHFSSWSIPLCRRILCLTFAASLWPLCLILICMCTCIFNAQS